MQFLVAILVTIMLGAILSLGLLMAMKGSLWLLAAGLLGYIFLFSFFGCLPPKSGHH